MCTSMKAALSLREMRSPSLSCTSDEIGIPFTYVGFFTLGHGLMNQQSSLVFSLNWMSFMYLASSPQILLASTLPTVSSIAVDRVEAAPCNCSLILAPQPHAWHPLDPSRSSVPHCGHVIVLSFLNKHLQQVP